MGDQEPKSETDRYEYFRNLPLSEIRQHYADLAATVEEVQHRYRVGFGKFRTTIRDEDMNDLGNVIRDLLPMSHNTAVQEELLSFKPEGEQSPDALMFNRIQGLTFAIFHFQAGHLNTSVREYANPYPNDF